MIFNEASYTKYKFLEFDTVDEVDDDDFGESLEVEHNDDNENNFTKRLIGVDSVAAAGFVLNEETNHFISPRTGAITESEKLRPFWLSLRQDEKQKYEEVM
ncbi:hypothetical protein KIN20_004806 [Parelaphostrongylus tenuis]|uniref:Uncharacterized protein n=1 Tax=Parelaphostrongylus tenuis TaxID=148309 RepID=A0AAD5MHJ0_PARTN|nr:hypothetical protein KIN20_004806 [Parelaphostrongylus tenuis]